MDLMRAQLEQYRGWRSEIRYCDAGYILSIVMLTAGVAMVQIRQDGFALLLGVVGFLMMIRFTLLLAERFKIVRGLCDSMSSGHGDSTLFAYDRGKMQNPVRKIFDVLIFLWGLLCAASSIGQTFGIQHLFGSSLVPK